MATEPVSKPQGWPERKAEGYEHSDVRPKLIGAVVAFLVVGAIALHFILGAQLRILGKSSQPRHAWARTKQTAPQLRTNIPRLQISASADLAEFSSREDAELNSYGWINKTQGIVHIPIQKAINLLIERNLLPAREGTGVVNT